MKIYTITVTRGYFDDENDCWTKEIEEIGDSATTPYHLQAAIRKMADKIRERYGLTKMTEWISDDNEIMFTNKDDFYRTSFIVSAEEHELVDGT